MRRVKCVIRYLAFVALVLVNAPVVEQSLAAPATDQRLDIRDLQFKRISNAQLDAIGEVRSIVQDAQGFMWFGAANGLARWDGYKALVFTNNKNDPHSLSTSNVNAMVTEPNGDVWVATYWGLNLYQASSERFYRYNFNPDDPRSLGGNAVMTLLKTQDGQLWVGTDGGGLMRYARESDDFERLNTDSDRGDSLASDRVVALAEDAEGLIWVGLKNLGVEVFDPRSQKVVQRFRAANGNDQGLTHPYAEEICRDQHGDMWVGTYDGVNRYLGDGRFKHYRFEPGKPHSLAAANVVSMMCGENYIWVGAGDRGVSIYDPDVDGFVHALDKNTFVRAIYTDSSGEQWLALARGSVARTDPYASAITRYSNDPSNENSLISSEVMAMVEDARGNFWVGTRGGLNYLDRRQGTVKRYAHRDGVRGLLPSPAVSALILQDDNTLWAGTPWGGLARLNIATDFFTSYSADKSNPHSLANPEVWSMHRDADGVLWVGTNAGFLHRYRPESDDFQRYFFAAAGGSSVGRALSIDSDSHGNLWISGDFGLYFFSKDNQALSAPSSDAAGLFEFIGSAKSSMGLQLSLPVTRHVFEDSKKNLWIATGGEGVVHWRPSDQSQKTYSEAQGLISNSVTATIEDENGHLWISTEAGISRLDPNTGVFKNFTSANGLTSDAHVPGAVVNTSRGEIAFGGLEGISIIDPQRTYTNRFQGPLLLTGMYLFTEPVLVKERFLDRFGSESLSDANGDVLTLEKSVSMLDRVVLNHKQSVVSFEFSLLSFDVPEGTQYRYMLEGFDERWSKPTRQRKATYTNLDSGKYSFRVMAINNEGLPMDSTIELRVIVLPPWWRTWWANSLYVLVFLLILYRIIRTQIEKRRFAERQSQLLEQKVHERTEALELAYKKMKEASYTDSLTQLRNRHYFQDVIPKEIGRLRRVFERLTTEQDRSRCERYGAFLILDIDHFKRINDEYGHAGGDAVLVAVSSVLRCVFRESDMLFRWGGEEFLAVCFDQKKDALPALAERVRQAVEGLEIELEERPRLKVTCSVGACHLPLDASDFSWASIDQTIALADWCLYVAKNSGRNCCATLSLQRAPDEAFKSFFANIEDRLQQGVAVIEGVQLPHAQEK
ncbi:MAG TPA: two-component regulator propeller domain-containing protein [Marinagarivorans sp.]